MTTTHQLNVSVLTAPIAQIDRRTLSQAWYSALQLARQSVVARTPFDSHKLAIAHGGRPRPTQTNAQPPSRRIITQPKRASTLTHSVGNAAQDRRAERSRLTRSIERVFLHPIRRPHAATVVFDDGSRFRFMLVERQGVVHLIAFAPRKHTDIVRRALDQARFALAQTGIILRSELREEDESHAH